MRLHEEQRGEVGHARAFGGASCFAAGSGEMMTDVGVEAFEPLRVHLAGEMGAFRQHGRVGGEIVGEGDAPLGLGKRLAQFPLAVVRVMFSMDLGEPTDAQRGIRTVSFDGCSP